MDIWSDKPMDGQIDVHPQPQPEKEEAGAR